MAPEDGSLLHILSKWNGKAWLLTHSGSCLMFLLLVNLCWLFFFPSYPAPKLFVFLFSCASPISFIFLLAYGVFTFIFFSVHLLLFHPCSSVLFLLPPEGWRNYFLFSKTILGPPSSLRLLLDSLIEGRRGKRSRAWCRWTRSFQVTNSTPPFLLLISQRKISLL